MIGPETKLYCLIGHPVSKSLSPKIHNAAFRARGIDAAYLAFDVPAERLENVVEGLRILSKGFNVTIPHKSAVLKHLDWMEDAVKAIGAVNTVKVDDGMLKGYNTDWQAIFSLLKPYMVEREVVILGAGGAARAVIYALKELGFRNVVVINRSIERAEKLASDFSRLGMDIDHRPLNMRLVPWQIGLFVNATPLGMYEDSPTLGNMVSRLSDAIVMDLAYSAQGTFLERLKPGKEFISGIEVLVEQAARAFEIWTGEEAPRDEMRRAAGIEG